MKIFLKGAAQSLLRVLAQAIIRKYRPDIIGVTGSVGKTTATEAINRVLSSLYISRRSVKNFNNEIGLPLTIIGYEKTPGKSLFAWIHIIAQAVFLIIKKNEKYPGMLVLEMGADKPGDISYLVKIAPPKIGVVTAVGLAHIEFFEDIEDISSEKGRLIESLPENGLAVLNYDDKHVYTMRVRSRAKVVTFGFHKESDCFIEKAEILWGQKKGLNVVIRYKNETGVLFLEKSLALHFSYALASAVCVGSYYGLTLAEIEKSLSSFQGPLGRMKLLDGIKQTFLIDDSYNSSPQAVEQALKTFSFIPSSDDVRKIAILGDMLELGNISEEEHKKIGRLIFSFGIDILVCCGELARDFARGAKEVGMLEDRVFIFSDCLQAAQFLQNRIKPGDIILVKGSQKMRMEKAVKELLARPIEDLKFLVRQESSWKKI